MVKKGEQNAQEKGEEYLCNRSENEKGNISD